MKFPEVPVEPEVLSKTDQLSLLTRRLIDVAKELLGSIYEFKNLPCKSLEERMYANFERQSIRLDEFNREYNALGGLDQKLLAVVPMRLYVEALDAMGDPEKVFINMKSCNIAKPSLRNMADLYGEVINGEDALLLELARLRGVNERLAASNAALGSASNDLLSAFQHSLVVGHERIVNLGGRCDSPGVMFSQEPAVRAMKEALEQQ